MTSSSQAPKWRPGCVSHCPAPNPAPVMPIPRGPPPRTPGLPKAQGCFCPSFTTPTSHANKARHSQGIQAGISKAQGPGHPEGSGPLVLSREKPEGSLHPSAQSVITEERRGDSRPERQSWGGRLSTTALLCKTQEYTANTSKEDSG